MSWVRGLMGEDLPRTELRLSFAVDADGAGDEVAKGVVDTVVARGEELNTACE